MYYRLYFVLITSMLSCNLFSQEAEIINPKGKLFFSAEMGSNTITSFKLDDGKNSLQGGVGAEYYFARHWSTSVRVKYFKTGLSYRSGSEFYRFNGEVLAIPINLKWEYRIVKNFSGNLKAGISLNSELKSDYDYPSYHYEESSFYVSFNPGFGFNYFINPQTGIYINYEAFVLGNERGVNDWIGPIPPHATNNSLINIGIKYSFRK